MRFEIDVEIPEGFEPTGEYRPPRDGDWFLDEYGGVSHGDNPARFRLILRERPLAYEDFEKRVGVGVERNGDIILDPVRWIDANQARIRAAALIAAADHVDRVNAQKERS